MPDRPPLAVLVGGAPGSGKTTLAEVLAVGLDLPVLHKDRLVHGRWRTLDKAKDLGESGIEPFCRPIELWIEAGISFLAEQTFYPDVSESNVATRLAPLSMLVNVHCRSIHSFERWELRMRNDPLCGEMRIKKLVPVVERLNSELYEPLDFGCPCVVVNTDSRYQPTLEAIIAESTICTAGQRPTTSTILHTRPDSATARRSGRSCHAASADIAWSVNRRRRTVSRPGTPLNC